MKLATFLYRGARRWGAAEADCVADLSAVLSQFRGIRDLLAGDGLNIARQAMALAPRIELGEINWLPVIPDPEKIICIGHNYEAHRIETGRERTAYPSVFTRWPDSQIGAGAPIIKPRASNELDFEGELALVIGKAGRHIAAEDAHHHIAGYAPYNDASVRDWQRHTSQFTPGKNFPATGAFGPWMVTVDEIADLSAQRIQTRLNGVVMQDAGFDQFIYSPAEIVAYCSTFTRLSPGDVIATGTPGGVGARHEPPLFMRTGDVIEVEISSVGVLVNGVADE